MVIFDAIIISLAHRLGLQVIAQGVETEAQRESLRAPVRRVAGLSFQQAPAGSGAAGVARRTRVARHARMTSMGLA